MSDDDDDAQLVVSTSNAGWMFGKAGDDVPEVLLGRAHDVWVHIPTCLTERRSANLDLLQTYCTEVGGFDRSALVSVPVLEDEHGGLIRDVSSSLLAESSRFDRLHLALQVYVRACAGACVRMASS